MNPGCLFTASMIQYNLGRIAASCGIKYKIDCVDVQLLRADDKSSEGAYLVSTLKHTLSSNWRPVYNGARYMTMRAVTVPGKDDENSDDDR